MDSVFLDKMKQRLEALRADLEQEDDSTAAEAAAPVKLDQASVGRLSRMDAMQGQAMALETRRRNQQRRAAVQLALARIERGEYGWCDDCDGEINPLRLEFDPTTRLCLTCASEREK